MNPFRRAATALTFAAVVTFVTPRMGAAETAVYEVDASHSSVLWRILHNNVANAYGRFNDLAGKVVIDDADPAKSSIQVTIKADSIDSGNEKRDQHLRGPDFLNAKQFPEISVKSTKVSKVDEKTYAVDANLSLHGVTKPLSFQFTRTGTGKNAKSGKELAGGEAQFTFKRSDFGITYGPQSLGDEITIIASLEGIRE